MKSDSQIQKDVLEEILWEPILDAAEIGVSVHNGVVTLSGTVSNYMKELVAESAAKRVDGVKAVALDIEVRLGSDDRRNDTEIAIAALDVLKWNTMIPDDKLFVKVEDGWVTLEGEVQWQYQKRAAADAIHCLKGVQGVANHIALAPKIQVASVKEHIRKALERSADVEARLIRVEADGNKVTLKGNVNSWHERQIVEQAVWSSPGVVAVVDNLLIGN